MRPRHTYAFCQTRSRFRSMPAYRAEGNVRLPCPVSNLRPPFDTSTQYVVSLVKSRVLLTISLNSSI